MEKRKPVKAMEWDMCNDILNFLRKLTGREERPKTDNPYKR